MYRFRDVSIESTEVDAMVVLGRGINEQGELSQTGYDRARAAAHLTYLMSNGPLRTVVNTGGRSWKQVLAGQMPPAEGEAMDAVMLATYSGEYGPWPGHIGHDAEPTSTSTTENLVNSVELLKPEPGDRIAILTDALHWQDDRPAKLARRVMPRIKVVRFILDNAQEPTPQDIKEEKRATMVTALFLGMARKGNLDGIMKQQRRIEKINARLRGNHQQ